MYLQFLLTVTILMSASVPSIHSPDILFVQWDESIYQEEVELALLHAPPNKSIYQLKGDAQTRAQLLLNQGLDFYGLPNYRLPGMLWNLVDGRAGIASSCTRPIRYIWLNEILFLYNYDEYMNDIIPHEVAHILVCLKHVDEQDGHGPQWQQTVRDLGYDPKSTHGLDTAPLLRLALRLGIPPYMHIYTPR